MGTKENANGLVVVAKPEPKVRAEKPKFEKAVWISRLGTSVTEDIVRDYITQNTSVSNCSVHKLVKKDRDLSTLNFISFEIAVNETDFAVLNDKNVWPANVMVREFVEIKPQTLGDFMPNGSNASSSKAAAAESSDDLMDLGVTTPTN